MASEEYEELRDLEEMLYAKHYHEQNPTYHHQSRRPSEFNRNQNNQNFEENNRNANKNRSPNRRGGRYWAPRGRGNYQQHPRRKNDDPNRWIPQLIEQRTVDESHRNAQKIPSNSAFSGRPIARQLNDKNSQQQQQTLRLDARQQFEKRKQPNKFPKKRGPNPFSAKINPFNSTNQEKMRRMNRAQQKKNKAIDSRQRAAPQIPDWPSTSRPVNSKITFDDTLSDSETIEPTEKKLKSANASKSEPGIVLSQDDDVIEIPIPPVPVIDLIDSEPDEPDEDEIIAKKLQASSRCVSPSNSSIMSDDFIAKKDQRRLNDDFYFKLPEDHDLRDEALSVSSDDSSVELPINVAEIEGANRLGCDYIVRGEAVERSVTGTMHKQLLEKSGQRQNESLVQNKPGKTTEHLSTNSPPRYDVYCVSDDEIDVEGIDDENPAPVDDDVVMLSTTSSITEEENVCDKSTTDCDILLNVSKNQRVIDLTDVEPQASTGQNTQNVLSTGENANKLDPEIGWNDEMKKYYHNSWGGEKFNISSVITPMPRDKNVWQIDQNDRFPPPPVRMKYRCRNCNEFSHKVSNCPLPKRRIVCHMCGEDGHREPRCPNTMCLTCGNPTRTFMRHCRKCEQLTNKRCTLCHVKGHVFSYCPDRWRRYHNTVEDNVPLNQEAVYSDHRSCCICASPDHFAHNCLSASRLLGTNVAKIKISSYLPYYQIDKKKPKVVNEVDYSMMSFMPNFEFNWSDNVKGNDKGFYNRFKEGTGLMQKELERQVADELESVRQKRKKVQKKVKKTPNKTSEDVDEDIDVVTIETSGVPEIGHDKTQNDENADVQLVEETVQGFSFTAEMKKIEESQKSFHLNLEEDNQPVGEIEPLTFDDCTEERAQMSRVTGIKESDIMEVERNREITFPLEGDELQFIPLNSGETNIVENTAHNEDKVEGKVFLTKEHSKILLNDGQAFLQEASVKYNLELRVVWESVGNMLMMHGLPENQDKFYPKLQAFLKGSTYEEHKRIRDNSFNLPKARNKLIDYIEDCLGRLRNDKRTMRELSDLMVRMNLNQRNAQFKAADKIRRQLNAFFFGKIGLREGKTHLIAIIKQLQSLKANRPEIELAEFRDELHKHFRYVFGSMEHEDYEQLLKDYRECCETKNFPLTFKQISNIHELIKMANESKTPSNLEIITEKVAASARTRNPDTLFYEDNVGDRHVRAIELNEVQNDETEEVNVTSPSSSRPQTPDSTTKDDQPPINVDSDTPSTSNSSNTIMDVDPVPASSTVSPSKILSHENPPENVVKDMPSKYYSEKSLEIITQALAIFQMQNNTRAVDRLQIVKKRAENMQITEDDYESLLNIQKIVNAKLTSCQESSQQS